MSRTARVASFATDDGELQSVEIEHRVRIARRTTTVTVDSGVDELRRFREMSPPIALLATMKLAEALDPGEAGPRESEVSEHVIPIDDTAVPIALARSETGVWVAATTVDEVTITARGDSFDPLKLRLVRILDATRYFAAA